MLRLGRRRRGLLAALVAATLLAIPSVAQAVPLDVNSSADVADPDPGNGVCEAPAPGTCTLRAAVQTANATVEADVIDLDADVYTVGIAGREEDAAATGDIDLTHAATINGVGRTSTFIDGADLDRVLEVHSGVSVTLRNLTARNGQTITGTNPASDDDGAGIRSAGTLTLDRVGVTFNTETGNTGSCGGVNADAGTVTIGDSVISGNTSDDWGGGVCGYGTSQVDVTDSTISDNSALGTGELAEGGGVIADRGRMALARTVVSGNTANLGGGIAETAGATVEVTDSTVRDNDVVTAPGVAPSSVPFNGVGAGMAELSAGNIRIVRSTFSGNEAVRHAGAIYAVGGAGADGVSEFSVANSTIADNRAASGGGIYIGGRDRIEVENATLDGNLATGSGGGLADAIGVCDGTADFGTCDGEVMAKNTIVSGGARNCASGIPEPAVTSLGNNIDSGDDCGLTAAGDKQNTNPGLGPLADNGGPTRTKMPGAAAINAGGSCPPPAIDQRGLARPKGGACDVGAVEDQNPPRPPPPGPGRPPPRGSQTGLLEVTEITSGPSGLTAEAPRFTFRSPLMGAAATFQCRFDNAQFRPCTTPHTGWNLTKGPHTFEVRAIDAGGTPDPTPASRSFTLGRITTSETCTVNLDWDRYQPSGTPASAQGCTSRETRCAEGSRCTIKSTVDVKHQDSATWRGETEIDIEGPNADLVSRRDRNNSHQCLSPSLPAYACPTSTLGMAFLGSGDTVRARCWAPSVIPFQRGPDPPRVLTCAASFTREFAPSLTAQPRSGASIGLLVPGAGTLTVTGGSTGSTRATGRKRKRPRSRSLIRTTRVRARKAGPLKFKLKLTRAAKKKLQRKRKLKLSARLTFKPRSGARRVKRQRLILRVPRPVRRLPRRP